MSDDDSSTTTELIARPPWLLKSHKSNLSKKELKKAAREIKLNPDYLANGWTPESLATYFKERREAQSKVILHRRPAKPKRTNGWHNAHRWRR